jgi:hypothetical protein
MSREMLEVDEVLRAAEHWKERCLRNDGSVFTERPLWQKKNFQALITHYVDVVDAGEGGFLEKLKKQLAPTAAEVKQLAAEMMWVMVLCPSNLNVSNKRDQIVPVWEWSGEKFVDSSWIRDPVLRGIGSGGQGFNTRRWREFSFFIRFMQRWKTLARAEQDTLLADVRAFGRWIDAVAPDENPQTRLMLMYLLFPDDQERIFSRADRLDIVGAFTDMRRGDIGELSATDLDDKLREIRRDQATALGTTQLDFYRPPLDEKWKRGSDPDEPPVPTSDKETILLTWNPNRFPWESLEQDVKNVRQGLTGDAIGSERWSVGIRRAIPKGSRFFMLRQSVSPKGIIGSGHTTSDVFEAAHFDESRDEPARYVSLKWDQLLEPKKEGCLDVQSFTERELRAVHWTPQSSGNPMKAEAASLLEGKWAAFLQEKGLSVGQPVVPPAIPPRAQEPPPLPDRSELFLGTEQLEEMGAALRRHKNVILQGPPGVGKTFLARHLAAAVGKPAADSIEMVQFHQAYSYEDFVQGLRPSGTGFKLTDGVFYRFCRRAMQNPNQPYVFIIDEINRGNLAAILGELMLLIESDKRGPTFAIPLTYSSNDGGSQRFFVPSNVHIIGLMNTADRSLALVDYALRRRFRFFSIDPQFNERFASHMRNAGCDETLLEEIIEKMRALNEEIAKDSSNLGRGFQIGHSYFCPSHGDKMDRAWFRDVIQQSIKPLLEEYWFDRPDQLEKKVQWLLS